MLTASVPISGGVQPRGGPPADDIATTSGSTPAGGCEVPCRRDPDLWFAENPRDLEQAKALCAECPIKAACLSGALSRGEPWGVWGGEIFDQGSVIARKRPRGRPRKHPAPPRSSRTNSQGEAA